MHYDIPFEKPECFLLLEFFFFYYREYSSTVEPLFLLRKLLGFSFVQHWYYFSLLVFSKHYTFFYTPCTLAIRVKCFVSFFFFKTCTPFCAEEPTLFLFVTHFCIQNAGFFYLLKYCLFVFVTHFYVENPVFFILFLIFEVVRVPAFLLTTIAVRNSRELGKMPPKKSALVCKSSNPTDFTAL